MVYRPLEVAQRLGISPSTLRLWSNHFAPLLSAQARKAPIGAAAPAAQRRYTDQDVDLLTRARDLLSQGLTYEETNRTLRKAESLPSAAACERPSKPEAGYPLPDIDLSQSLREALEAKDKTITALKESLAFMDVYLRTVLQEREDARSRERLLQQQMDRLQQQPHEPDLPLPRPWWKRLLAIS